VQLDWPSERPGRTDIELWRAVDVYNVEPTGAKALRAVAHLYRPVRGVATLCGGLCVGGRSKCDIFDQNPAISGAH